MLTNSADIIRRLEREGWDCVRIAGSHHVFKKSGIRDTIVVPHPKKSFGPGLVLKSTGRLIGPATDMTDYVAIIEDAGPDFAVGVWFPDLPGCYSAGDTLDEALTNAPEAVALWFEDIEAEGRTIPRARTPSELKADPEIAADMAKYAIALIPAPDVALQPAAE